MAAFLFLLAFLLLFALDVATLWWLAGETTWLWAVAAAVGGVLVGIVLLRIAGPYTVVRVMNRVREGRLPGTELVDALLLLIGSVLFMTPGLASDVVALFLVLPGLRAGSRRVLGWTIGRRVRVVRVGTQVYTDVDQRMAGRGDAPASRGDYVDADYRRED